MSGGLLALFLVGFLLAGIMLAAATLHLNQFEQKVDGFCTELLERYRPKDIPKQG